MECWHPGLAQEVGLSAEKVTGFLLPLARGNAGAGRRGRAAAAWSWVAGEEGTAPEGQAVSVFLQCGRGCVTLGVS